ncbi:unnamed protein product [Boreogadus saida]
MGIRYDPMKVDETSPEGPDPIQLSLVLDQERVELTEHPVYATVSGWAVSPAHSLGVDVKWGRQKGRGPGLVTPGFLCVYVEGRLVVVWSGGRGCFWSVSPAHILRNSKVLVLPPSVTSVEESEERQL